MSPFCMPDKNKELYLFCPKCKECKTFIEDKAGYIRCIMCNFILSSGILVK